MIGIAVFAAFLYILVAKYGDIIVEDVRLNILGIALGALTLEVLARKYLPGILWALLIMLVVALLIGFALMQWCKIQKPAAIKIVGIFTGVRLAVAAVVILLMTRAPSA